MPKVLPFLLILFVVCVVEIGFSQTLNTAEIKDLIEAFKKDERGPYQAIRWFCPDGRVLPPNERCEQPGAIQHALPKEAVQKLAREQGIYLGQILAGSSSTDFLDAANQNSRLKQYQMEKYLQAVDNGWIIRRARYYRGAVQAEDESDWGEKFLGSLLADNEFLDSQFYLAHQITRDIPHQGKEDHWQKIRALSKTLGDSLPAFTDLRVKLHGQPEGTDILRVKDFYAANRRGIRPEIDRLFQELIRELEIAYQPFDLQFLGDFIAELPEKSPITGQLKKMMRDFSPQQTSSADSGALLIGLCEDIAELLWTIRSHMPSIPSRNTRLALMNLSNNMEGLLFRMVGDWNAKTLGDLCQKSYILAKAAAGCGYLEIWEWEAVEPWLYTSKSLQALALEEFLLRADYARRVVEWGTGMTRAVYEPVVSLYRAFEPLATGLIDDRVRSSVLLPLGEAAAELKETVSRYAGITNQVMTIKNPGGIQGLNAGFALGQLEVVTESPEKVDFSANKIYVLERAPADLRPVAGILTVSEGNLVSHVQLLARNLGIPNAVISTQNLYDLLPFSGQTVFYVVSPRGTVIMKPASSMTSEEKELVATTRRPESRIAVPLERLDLTRTALISLRNLRASESGGISGPKAANLGELKHLFPDKVVEGLVIPFGVFRQHLNQLMPGTAISYWQFLQETFAWASMAEKTAKSEAEIETEVLARLAQLREAIKTMPFLPGFQDSLQQGFLENFTAGVGEQAVFIRSDTNMEDLKEFTGAGLNLTVFNVVEEEKIMQGIRDVWASPYTERSYRWRQKYLLNPENVYPSILILPTVTVDKSGVVITSGILSGDPEDITIAFSRGAGGAVEGQAAESYLWRSNGDQLLLSPAREIQYTLLPPTGGIRKGITHFHQPILNREDLNLLRKISREIVKKLATTPAIGGQGPWDIELGFRDRRIWLFQVRPYVENKRARSSRYLISLDPQFPKNLKISLAETLKKA